MEATARLFSDGGNPRAVYEAAAEDVQPLRPRGGGLASGAEVGVQRLRRFCRRLTLRITLRHLFTRSQPKVMITPTITSQQARLGEKITSPIFIGSCRKRASTLGALAAGNRCAR